MSTERIIKPRESYNGFVYIRDLETALKINHDYKGFAPPDMEQYLFNLQQHTQIELPYMTCIVKNALFFMRGPRHTALRKETLKIFGKKSIENWSSDIADTADKYARQIAFSQHTDLIKAYAYPIFTEVTQRILGIRPTDPETFDYWTMQLQVLLQPLLPIRELKRMETAFAQLLQQTEVIVQPDGSPKPTLMQILLKANLDDFDQLDALAATIVVYGAAINLSQTLTNIIWHILHGGAEIKSNAARPEWVTKHLEYLIKIGSSPRYIHTLSATDRMIGQTTFKKGDNVVLDLLEIHQLGCPFSKPDLWDAKSMSHPQHMAFGTGIRFCIGAFLTRKVIEKSIPLLFARFPNMECDLQVPVLSPHQQAIVIEKLPVTINRE